METRTILSVLFTAVVMCAGSSALAAEKSAGAAAKIDSEARSSLNKLYASVPAAKALGGKAVAILVFPKVIKAGLMVGGQYGEGALIKGGKTAAYYSTGGASYGLQAGAQTYGYALFFMNDNAVTQLDQAKGFEVGAGPSVVMMDEGMAKTTTTTTMKSDIYAFVFGQSGLMAGIGLQGNKITRIEPK